MKLILVLRIFCYETVSQRFLYCFFNLNGGADESTSDRKVSGGLAGFAGISLTGNTIDI